MGWCDDFPLEFSPEGMECWLRPHQPDGKEGGLTV